MNLRIADKKDYEKIYDLTKRFFETAYVSDGNEQDFVLDLRKREEYIPELEFILENEGEIIGHIIYTKKYVMDNDENPIFEDLLLDQVSIDEKF